MIIERVLDKDCKVELTGQKVKYTIAASAKAFKILSDNLYQKKIEATINARLGKMYSRGLVRTEYNPKFLKTRGSMAIWEVA
jgi:hypothetical protein